VFAVPLMTPAELRLYPEGSAPEAIDHVYGVAPPLATRVCEYATPAVPLGSGEAVVIDKFPNVVTEIRFELTLALPLVTARTR
jgi:hypothetical protein